MAIKNASDLLVYAKTTDPAEQVTRIYVKTVNPFIFPDGASTARVAISNVTNASGEITDGLNTTTQFSNTGADALTKIRQTIDTTGVSYGYQYSVQGTSGDYTYVDFTNGAVGIVPTLQIVSGTVGDIAIFKDDSVIVEVLTPGSSAIFDPVAYSTSASFSTNMDLRDVTNKDSDGWSESLGGLKSFEVSTDILQSINPDVPLDGTDFFDKLKERSLVDLSFSDRIRNIIRTNLTQSGVDGFILNTVTQVNLQEDVNGTFFASKITSTTSNWDRLKYTIDATRLEGKKITWSFYVKGVDASNKQASWLMISNPSADPYAEAQNIGYSDKIISGDGEISSLSNSNVRTITGLSTTEWTRVAVSLTLPLDITSGDSSFLFLLYPGDASSQSSSSMYTCFWQIETTPEATDYQDPTDITHWQGNALVSSVSFDAGVEDNLTCSATFTGTGNIYPNGLGPELIGDTGFDDPNYWTVNPGTAGTSVVEDGYGKILSPTGAITSITKDLGLYSTPGDFFSLTYTVHTSTQGGLAVHDGWDTGDEVDMRIPSSVGTHTVLLKPGQDILEIKRSSGATTIWLSSISLKKVL